MRRLKAQLLWILLLLVAVHSTVLGFQSNQSTDEEFGPVVRAYLGYLRSEQEVVDDRASRREISTSYYRRNSNRIKALRQMALKLARDSHNDYLPELEAIAGNEFSLLFEKPPAPATLKIGQVLKNTFRYLGSVRSGEVFYIFARLDPYEQSELTGSSPASPQKPALKSQSGPTSAVRSRRVNPEP